MENNYEKRVKNYETLGVEMESFALFHNARVLNKSAACILTVSDSFLKSEELTPKEREQGLNKMIELALDTIINLKEEKDEK